MLLGLQNVTFEFGARVIVEDATWHIQPGDRVGLIGYNGTGKSTLLKIMAGLDKDFLGETTLSGSAPVSRAHHLLDQRIDLGMLMPVPRPMPHARE